MKIVAEFKIPYYQYLNEKSELIKNSPALGFNFNELKNLYRQMVLLRVFDAKAVALQRTGKLGTYPSTRGQEAVFVGAGAALKATDVYLPFYRDVGTMFQRGVKFSEILLFWGGDERGNDFSSQRHDFPYSIPVGSQLLHAAGVAFACKYKNEKVAVMVSCGDGATSQGDFYEALNIAGIWQLPVVFIICNNQWAISVPRHAQTAAQTLAQKAIAAGIPGEQVDGNDIVAIHERLTDALTCARERQEPRLIELVCYRQHDHTTADDASRYEPAGIRALEWEKEPIQRLRQYLEKAHEWNQQQEIDLQKQCMSEIDAAILEYTATPPQPLQSMFDFLYETLPRSYQSQREVLQALKI